jgi:hypothetical protein
VLSALAPSAAAGYRSDSGLSDRNLSRRSRVARQHFPRTTTSAIVPIWQFQRPTRRSPCRAGRTMASVKSSGCCLRTRCAGITLPTPGGMTRLDPIR